jgi:Mg-chelatase subunit ChlD
MRRTALLLAAVSPLVLALVACGAAPMAASSDTSPRAPGGAYPPAAAVAQTTSAGEMVPSTAAAPMAMATAAAPGLSPAPGPAVAASAEPSAVAIAPAGVRAGEWDDNANYRDFIGYIKKSQNLGIEQLDISARRFLVVEDKNGNGVPNCKITVSDPQTQKTATLTTAASGRAVFFPRMFGMNGKLSASTSCLSQNATSMAFDATDTDGAVRIKLPVARADASKPALDVVFILDTTGSMSEEIKSVKATLNTVLAKLDTSVQIRVGLVEYKDKEDTFVTKTYALTSDVKSLSASIAQLSAAGGGDTPEDVDSGLAVAVAQMQWNEKAVARLAFLIADAPPHLDYADSTSYGTSAKRAAEKGIKVFTVAASGMDAQGQAVFRQIAQVTGATNMFVLRGGAGPQSTGGGDPTSSCGGTHQNYSSGNLDQLIVDKIALEITSLKADPMRIAGLDKDETAKPCNDRIMVVAR